VELLSESQLCFLRPCTQDFNMSILAAHMRPNSKYEIVKV
jgi:hypothetical protein